MEKSHSWVVRPLGEKGQGMAEYALILAGVAVVAMAALTPLGTAIFNLLTNITGQL